MQYTITKVIPETHDTISIYFDGPKMEFIPGQFVMINFPVDGNIVKRAYSIANSPTKDYLQITVKEVPSGFISKRLQSVKVGQTFEIAGPYGRFCFDENKQKKIVLIGAGSGVVPYLSILEYISDKKLTTSAVCFTSHRYEKDCIFRSQFEKLAKDNSNISLYQTVTRDSDNQNWPNNYGRITKDSLLTNLGGFDLDNTYFFLCGPENFVRGMEKILIESNVAKEKIVLEVYG
jgi:ferredoxin-NADP reductase